MTELSEPGESAGHVPPFDAVILAGGGSRRMGGVDKMTLDVGGHQLLDRVLHAVRSAGRVVVAGPPRELEVGHPALRWVQESPPGGGPVAGLAAALDRLADPDGPGPDHAVPADRVAVLAGDLPFVDEAVVERLGSALSAAPDAVGAVLVDATGRDQPLISLWRSAPLRSAMPAEPAGSPVWRVLAPLTVTRVRCGQPMLDCDTPYELDLARSLAALDASRGTW